MTLSEALNFIMCPIILAISNSHNDNVHFTLNKMTYYLFLSYNKGKQQKIYVLTPQQQTPAPANPSKIYHFFLTPQRPVPFPS
jgi:hypothetical protein